MWSLHMALSTHGTTDVRSLHGLPIHEEEIQRGVRVCVGESNRERVCVS